MNELIVIALLLPATLLGPTTAAAAEKAAPIPPKARITLALDRDEFFLGENILIHYCIENMGGAAFSVHAGGDYRGGTRANRFQITATGADGKLVADPDPVQRAMGGMGGPSSLTNGATWFEQVWLARYCLFEKPGVYTVRVFHDLGWGQKQVADAREVTVTLTLKRPKPEQARKVVDEMFAALKYGGPNRGQRSQPRADFAVLRDPVYLPILMSRAQAGSLEALRGLASIAAPEATAALIEFLKPGKDRPLAPAESWRGRGLWLPSGAEAESLALAAAIHLQTRLPQLEPTKPPPVTTDTPRLAQLRQTWRPEFAPIVRTFAMRLLAETNRDAFLIAAAQLNSLGRPEDVPVLMAALERAVAGTLGVFRADHSYPEPVSACGALASLCARFSTDERAVQTEPTTRGRALLYLDALKTNAAACPPGWETNCASLLRNELPYLRAQTLAHLPRPLPDSLARMIAPLMLDTDVTVQNRAFLIAQELKAPEYRALALKVLATADDSWLIHSASRVAFDQGATYECARIWAQRFEEKEKLFQTTTSLAPSAMRALWGAISGGHVSGGFIQLPQGERLRGLKERWIKFIEDHRDELAAGRRFRPGDGVVPKELLPEGWQFYPPKESKR